MGSAIWRLGNSVKGQEYILPTHQKFFFFPPQLLSWKDKLCQYLHSEASLWPYCSWLVPLASLLGWDEIHVQLKFFCSMIYHTWCHQEDFHQVTVLDTCNLSSFICLFHKGCLFFSLFRLPIECFLWQEKVVLVKGKILIKNTLASV